MSNRGGGRGGEGLEKLAAVQASLERGATLAAAMREKNERLLRELAASETAAGCP